MHSGGDWTVWKYRAVVERRPPLVLLLDISGSMSAYSRAVLYFCHALLQSRERLQVFLFGTRLTNATRALRERDPDVAIAALGQNVADWSGGTRIGAALAEFNRRWARRVFAGRATVLLVTDGLDHETIDVLDREMQRLARFAHRSAGVAQSAVAIRRFFAARARRARDPAARRCDARGPQPRQPRRCQTRTRGAIEPRRATHYGRLAMELTETHVLPVPQERAWEALNDTSILKACIPGCDNIEADGENAYAVGMTAAVGPVKARFKGRFKGRMQLTDIDAPHTYTIQFEGQGGAVGFSKGSAKVNLEPGDESVTTKLIYSANAQVGGKLAQIGSRLVDGAARKIAAEFF